MTFLTVKVDVRQAQAAADRIERVSGSQLARAAVQAVNDVALRYEEAAPKRIGERVNLQPAYVKSKTDLKLAEEGGDARAEITVSGDLTILGRYGPIEYRLAGAQRKAGAVRGNRSAGVGVEITRGAPVVEEQWFLMRLRVGVEPGTNVGVFVRTSADPKKPKHIYGPSPYALMRRDFQYREPDVLDDLERTAAARLVDAMEL